MENEAKMEAKGIQNLGKNINIEKKHPNNNRKSIDFQNMILETRGCPDGSPEPSISRGR